MTTLREGATSKEARPNLESYFKREYGRPNLELRSHLFSELGPAFQAHAEQVINYGITRVRGLFSSEAVTAMQEDIARWKTTKEWDNDRHIGFDGNSGEQYLETSNAISKAITNPGLHSLVTASFGQHHKLSFFRTVLLDPIPPYERRAFQWHHDGYSEFGLKAMLLLTDVPENGQAMLYVPSTQQRSWETTSSRETRFAPEFVSNFDPYTCSGKAGDIFIFNPHAIHRGQRNSIARRDIALFNFQSGLARNYPVPRLAPEVAAALSPYERYIYGIEGLKESGDLTEADFIDKNESWRKKMGDLYQEYTLPVTQIQTFFDQERLDNKITLLGKYNAGINPQGDRFVDADLTRHVERFKDTTRTKLGEVTERLASDQSINQALSQYRIDLQGQIRNDLHGDLDLPIRLYHPNKDQRRDNAITQTRDGRGDEVIVRGIKRLSEIGYQDFIDADATGYETIADRMLGYKDALLLLPESQQERLHTDSFLSFISDLSEMIKRAYTTDLARKTMIYTYLAGQTLADKFHEDERLPNKIRQQLQKTADEALITYAKMSFLDKERQQGNEENVIVTFNDPSISNVKL